MESLGFFYCILDSWFSPKSVRLQECVPIWFSIAQKFQFKTYPNQGILTEGDLFIKVACFVTKECNFFNLKIHWSKQVSTRRSTILILPHQQGSLFWLMVPPGGRNWQLIYLFFSSSIDANEVIFVEEPLLIGPSQKIRGNFCFCCSRPEANNAGKPLVCRLNFLNLIWTYFDLF